MPTRKLKPATVFPPEPAKPTQELAAPEMIPVSVPTAFGRRVAVVRRTFGKDTQEEEVAWPADCRLPIAGEAIHLPSGLGGFIEYIDWDLAAGVVRVNIR